MEEKKNKIIGIIVTISFHIVLLIFCILFGFTTPLPLPEEQGVEVNLGNSEEGMGDIQPENLTQNVSGTVVPKNYTPNNYVDQINEESVNLNHKNKNEKVNQKPKETKEEVKEENKINQLALFQGNKNKVGGSEGNSGKPGDQGNPLGNPNADNYQGNPGSGGGPSFSLKGRTAKLLPKPDYNSNEQGTVVVKIWVNNNGEVTRVEAGQRGTTTSDRTLWKLAESAALKARFSPDSDAPEDQTGTITYRFIRLN